MVAPNTKIQATTECVFTLQEHTLYIADTRN